MKKLLFLFLLQPFLLHSQGIRFENNLSWAQIKQKAKAENKYILVDCYATWCGPCKWMEQNVYPDDSVGNKINARFIAVKVQMDKTANDNDQAKTWYPIARQFEQQYAITAYPAYLFFSPDGVAVHKAVGSLKKKEFCALAAEALHPGRQYYVLLDAYKNNRLPGPEMPALANRARSFDEENLAEAIAGDYIHHYLEKLSDKEFLAKENMEFMDLYPYTSKDRFFKLCYTHPGIVDSVLNLPWPGIPHNALRNHFARAAVDNVIANEEITPLIKAAKNNHEVPDWKQITRHIKTKYGERYVRSNVAQAQADWYRDMQDWKNYTTSILKETAEQDTTDMPPSAKAIFFNNQAWEIVIHSDDRGKLKKALSWMDFALSLNDKPSVDAIDTKANILYRLGNKDDAIATEAKAVSLSKRLVYRETLDKMKNNTLNW